MVKVEQSEKFQQISNIQKINGKLAYICWKVQDKIYIKYGDKEYGPYDFASQLIKFKEGIAYFAGTQKQIRVYVDGEPKSKIYPDFYHQIVEYKGEPLYQPQTNEGRILMHGDKQIAGPFPFSKQHKVINEVIYWGVRKTNGKMCLLSIKDNKITEATEYISVGSPITVNNKIVYGAKKSDEVQVLVYDDQEMTAFEEIGRIQECNGKLVYTAKKAENEWYVIQEGKEHGPHYQIGPIVEYKDGIAYNASDKEGKIWNVYLNQKKQQIPSSKGIGYLTVIHDKLGFIYLNKRDWCFVRVGDKDFPKEYPSAKHLMAWGDDVIFAAASGDAVPKFKLSINGIEEGKEYKGVLAMVPIGNKLYMNCFSSQNFRYYIQTVTKE